MGIVSKLFPRDDANAKPRASATTDWIDLSDYAATEKTGEAAAATWIRFASLRQLDDLKTFSSHVYDGNVLVLDFSAVANDDVTLRRMTNELRKIAADTGGDIAGLGDHHILLTPAGVKVDRNKLTVKKGDADEAPQMRTSYNQAPPPMPAPSPAPPAPTAASGPSAPPASVGRRMNGTRK
jgi:uncharacterized protein